MQGIQLLEQWIKPGNTVMATEVSYDTVVLAEAESPEKTYEIVDNTKHHVLVMNRLLRVGEDKWNIS